MIIEGLIPGFKFIKKYNLTQKELEMLMYFFEKPHSASELSKKLNKLTVTVHQNIQRLRLKNLLNLKDRDDRGNNTYEFNKTQLED